MDTDLSIKQRFWNCVALWYSYQFERVRVRDEDLLPVITLGSFCQIVTSEPAPDEDPWDIEPQRFARFVQSMRMIRVVAYQNARPNTIILPGDIACEERPVHGVLLENDSYFVYYVYNLKWDVCPKLVIIDTEFMREHHLLFGHDTVMIRDLDRGIKRRRLKIHRLWRFTSSVERMVWGFGEKDGNA